MELIVHTNQEGVAQTTSTPSPTARPAHRDHEDRGAEAGARQATASTPPSAAPAATRRSRARRSASSPSATAQHRWDPKNQRPELWKLYNARKKKGESIRVFPLSNWTELDIWQYIWLGGDPHRAAVFRRRAAGGRARRHADHGRRRPHAAEPGEQPMMKRVRFRTLGCYPLTGAIESNADDAAEIIQEMLLATDLRAPGPGHRPRRGRPRWRRRSRRGYF
jgi:sulfate adenylyltransferase subunit 2